MKKTNCFLLLLFCLLLAACGQTAPEMEDLGEEYREGMDYQTEFGFTSMPVIQKVGDGYYFLVSQRLYYYCPSMKQAVPVCSKADCSHRDSGCNASMEHVDEINYYDHKFYYIAPEEDDERELSTWFLCYLSEDGSRREKVAQLAVSEWDDTGGFSSELCVHRGNAYIYFDNEFSVSPKKEKAVLKKINLEGTPVCSDVTFFEGYGVRVDGVTAYGNTLVVTGSYSDVPYGDFHTHTDFIDIRNGEQKRDVLYDEYILSKQNNNVYYDDGNKLFLLDLDTGERRQIEGVAVDVMAVMSGKYIYSCNEDVCREKNDYEDYGGKGYEVYDMDGKKIAQIPLEAGMEFENGDEDFCFATGFSSDDTSYVTHSVYLFDKKQLFEGGTEWKQILTRKEEG